MLLTLISMLGGGFMRMLPEIIGFFNKKADNAHELAMLDRQIALQQQKSADDRATLVAQGEQTRATAMTEGEINMNLAQLDAVKEALKDQMQKTGYALVDFLNFCVRPIVTYFFVGLYGAVKISTIVIAFQQKDIWTAIVSSWNPDDKAILSGILAFWFVGRVFDKKQ